MYVSYTTPLEFYIWNFIKWRNHTSACSILQRSLVATLFCSDINLVKIIRPSFVIWFVQQMQGVKNFEASEPVVIIGFGQMGQVDII